MTGIDDATMGAIVKSAMRGIEKSSSHLERGALAGAAMLLGNYLHEHGLPSLEINLQGLDGIYRIKVTNHEL